MLNLNWGGTMAVGALATPEGGGVTVHDASGKVLDTLPRMDGATGDDAAADEDGDE